MDFGSFWVVYVNKSTEILKITIFTSIWEDDILSFEHKCVISQRKTNINIQINQMNKPLTLLIAMLASIAMHAQTDYFTPYQQTKLRLPSNPLITNDPYISFWSPNNKLTGGTTRHWTGAVKAMDGILRVDGQSYRFMGTQKDVLLEAIAPMGSKGRWAAKIKRSGVASNWYEKDASESGWTTKYGAFGSMNEYDGVTTDWTDISEYYIRRHVTLTEEDLKSDLWIVYSHDDNFELYINGVKLAEGKDTWRQNVRVHLQGSSRDALVAGDNVIAFHVANTRGGALADVGFFRNILGFHPGMQSIAPMADEGPWDARVRTATLSGTTWTTEGYDDTGSAWETQSGAFGSTGEPYVNTPWSAQGSNVYIRRRVNLTAEDLQRDLHIIYSHDDVCEGYINGRKIFSTGETWVKNVDYQLTNDDKAVLHEGENIIAYHVHNTTGGALADIGLYYNITGEQVAEQTNRHVLATNTYYKFTCGPVTLDVVFTAPMLMKDVELMSTPINFISYQVTSNDGEEHDVQFYFATSPELTVNNNMQPTISSITEQNGIRYIKSGAKTQNVLGKAGDMICIDWGYLYIPEINGTISIGSQAEVSNTFVATGKLPEASSATITSSEDADMPLLAFSNDMGKVTQASSYMMIGYDEVKDIRYMDFDYKGYWARNGKTIFAAFEELRDRYDQIMTDCQAQDKEIYDDGLNAGNTKYAELLSGCYRHVIAAHKIFQDKKGNLLFFSKENNSNGCVNTVDLTYPSAPLFLIYNTDLMKGMCTSILDYCESDRWGFDFAAHDLGTYPHANNQVYSIRFPDSSGGFAGNMPIEESGNIVVLAAAISLIDGNLTWANKYWNTLKKWTDYLVENGLDPENQLCTDDFAGHLAHNANLSLKAIMGITGFSLMCKQKGDMDSYNYYFGKAQEMATEWVQMAKDGTHYKLAFDKSGTWSQKYNMVWDKVWQTKLFSDAVYKQEMLYYAGQLKTYGLPLDNRSVYTKSDWISWTACLGTQAQFTTHMDRLYKYANETTSRVPLSDWFYTDSGNYVAFIGRSVVGGHWMKVLLDKCISGELMTGIDTIEHSTVNTQHSVYNLAGQKLSKPQKGVNIINGKKVIY